MAVAKKRSFLMYCDLKPQIDMLSYEEKGRLFEAIYDYECGGEIKKLPPKAEIVYRGMEAQLKRDRERYEETCRKKAEAGKKGMAIRWGKADDITEDNRGYQAITEDNKGYQAITEDNKEYQAITKITDIDIDKEKDKEKDIDKEKDNDIDKEKDNDIDKDNVLSEEEFMRMFYTPERIAENERLKKESVSLFQSDFGRKPTEKEKELLLSLAYGTDKEILDYAFEQAVMNNRKNLGYVQGVIKKLKDKGITNMREMVEYDMRTGII